MNAKDQEILDLKFKSIQLQIESFAEVHEEINRSIDSKLSQILEQTIKTNGRVTALEKWKSEHELVTEKNLLEYNFIKKYPKLMLIAFVAMIILTIVNIAK